MIGCAARRSSRRSLLARFRPVGAALMPYRDRGERGPDHRVRADHERVVRPARQDLEDGDRRRALLLPRAREHAARADVGPPAVDRADALLRRRRGRRSSGASASRPRCRSSSPALKIATVLAMIGAIVGEYFGGSLERARRPDQQPTRSSSTSTTAWAGDRRRLRSSGSRFYLAVVLAERSTAGACGAIDSRSDENGSGSRPTDGRDTRKEERNEAQEWVWRSSLLASRVARARRRARRRGARPAAPKLTKVTLQLKWVTQAQFAGYYAAKAKGYYKQAGPRRQDQARRAGHHARAGRRRRAGRVRHRLAAEPASPRATRAATSSTSRRSSRARHDELTWKERDQDDREDADKKVGELALRQRVRALRRADEERHRTRRRTRA